MSICPCGSQKDYSQCCQTYIEKKALAETAEQLMRARYTAHTLADIGFIIETHHPHTRTEIDEQNTQKWAEESTWLGIEIKNVIDGGVEDESGFVEFVATYRDQQGRRQSHHELSEFEKLDGKWYFKDARAPKIEQFRRDQPKIGRNDPCFCGSGKKYKKCCANIAG